MKRMLRSMDPYELRQAGYEIVDSGYARGKEDFEVIKQNLAKKYDGVKVYRVATDTPGLIMFEAYAPITDVDNQ